MYFASLGLAVSSRCFYGSEGPLKSMHVRVEILTYLSGNFKKLLFCTL
jgi:hypothetical protein